jgi:hypothetical protein
MYMMEPRKKFAKEKEIPYLYGEKAHFEKPHHFKTNSERKK